MGVTFIAKEGTYTAPATLTTKTITENGTYSAVDDSANGYSSVTVEVEGGGGSNDFSTAEVTVNNETMFAPMLAYIDNTNGVVSRMGASGVYDVVLYKGKANGTLLAPSASVSVTGNITFDDDTYEFVVTGDGTITITE